MKKGHSRMSSLGQLTSMFQIGQTQLSYRPFHYQFLIEVYILDVYRSHLLRKGDVVLDLGAGIGDFSVLASHRVGPSGKVIALEPDKDDYELLLSNIKANNCKNIIALNIGVADAQGSRTISFRSRNSSFRVNTLPIILNDIDMADKINFVKMDIEGYEKEVVRNGLELIKDARVISVELHNTKQAIDDLLIPQGYCFVPLSKYHIYKRVLSNMIFHPVLLSNSYRILKKQNPRLLSSVSHGMDYDKNAAYLTGSYLKNKYSSAIDARLQTH